MTPHKVSSLQLVSIGPFSPVGRVFVRLNVSRVTRQYRLNLGSAGRHARSKRPIHHPTSRGFACVCVCVVRSCNMTIAPQPAISSILFVVVVGVVMAALTAATTTVTAFVPWTTTNRGGCSVTAATSATTTSLTTTRLHAIDPTKEVGVLAPVGFFEYVCVSLWSVCMCLLPLPSLSVVL
jgi:hypothetical protein